MFSRSIVALVVLGALGLAGPAGAVAGEGCSNEALRETQRSTYLPDCRAYELVSPPEKKGGDVMAYSPRTRAAADGNAVAYGSVVGFGELQGTGAGVDYLAERVPGLGRWVTHGIDPAVPSNDINALGGIGDTYYDGDLSPDLSKGVVASVTPVTGDENVKGVANLYVRDDLRSPGAGSYSLLTGCPLCESTSSPLPALPAIPTTVTAYLPVLAGASPDMGRVVFTSIEDLTSDAPAQSSFCGNQNPSYTFTPPAPLWCAPRVYEWDHGTVRLVSVLPKGEAADAAGAGSQTASTVAQIFTYSPRVVSDETDGHSRVIFTQLTDESGKTLSEFESSDVFGQALFLYANTAATHGNVFMRVDHTQTVQVNVSERTTEADTFKPAKYLDASSNGERVFFMTSQMLTNDAQSGGQKIYMYDTTKPEGEHLTLISPPEGSAEGLIGVGADGHYAYMIEDGRFMLWNDGKLTDMGPEPFTGTTRDLLFTNLTNYAAVMRQGEVTPDGRHLVVVTDEALAGHDAGKCRDGFGCREVYVYSAETGEWDCASCTPVGVKPKTDASLVAGALHGGARVTSHVTREMSENGEFVFFNTADSLVAQDTNGKLDAYVYNTRTKQVALLSSGTDPSDSFYVDSSANGHDAFIVTRQSLVGWDTDNSYDMYDVRVGGGLPEPVATVACSSTCRGVPGEAPSLVAPASVSLVGAGNLVPSTGKGVVVSRAQRLKQALRACHKRRSKRQRKRCEAGAQKRFGKASGVGRGK